ncbi:unnamed protein product [Protopolystoma xenopodis]|uniref:PAS domain-containing protein n=1 Tax=Protopolystoma xenopodis TaxID=117903 RepID=A0A3S5BG38_9PLAT|nr:unnamed protein product [Protopolystoma xenopodis]
MERKFLIANALLPRTPIIFCNDVFCHLCGYTRAEIIQKSACLEFLYGPLTSPNAIKDIRLALSDFEEREITMLLYPKDGTTI